MNNMKISYYELLGMIKVGKYPIIEYDNIKYIPDFDIVDGSFTDYQIEQNQYNYNEAKFYLVENLLDCEMFNKVLTIVEQATPKEDKKIEKLIDELTYIKLVDDKTFRKNVVNKINELVDKVNGE